MNRILKSGMSVIIMMLILFFRPNFNAHALQLTDTIFTIPVDEIELIFQENLNQSDNNIRYEHIGLGFGILQDFSMWISTDYLHSGILKTKSDELGDASIKLSIYSGDYFDELLHMGFIVYFNFPTGRDAYSSTEFNNVAFGNNEIKFGPVFQADILNKFFIHLNILYIFREGDGENFYNGFYVNILKKDTYTKLFGLNPFGEDTFLGIQRLKNDYMSFSFAINTNILYPVIPYFEFYWSDYLYKKGMDDNDPGLLPNDVSPILLSVGMRFFFSSKNFTGFYFIVNPIIDDNQMNAKYGLEFSLLF